MQAPPFKSPDSQAVLRVLQLSQEVRRHPVLGYSVAFASIGIAGGLQWLAQDQYSGAPFLTIYPAVILATLIGGFGPGYLSGVLAGLVQWGFFIPKLHWFAVASYAFDATVCVLLIVLINETLDLLVADVAREKQAKQQQHLLATELHHRIQNLLTVIQAVIRFSLPGDGMVKTTTVKQQLMDRLQSMSAANRAITDSMGDGVPLSELLGSEIRGFENRFEITGGIGLVLASQITQDFSLILHELLTNAIKHGALSVPNGRVSVRFDWTPPLFIFSWEERNGPQVALPTSSGFGSRILGTFAKSFSRSVDASYAVTGLCYTLQIETDQIKRLELRPYSSSSLNDMLGTPMRGPEAAGNGRADQWSAEKVSA